MTQPAYPVSHTFAEYLALEAGSEAKHELVNGEIYAMSGGTPEHSRLGTNIASELRTALVGKRCAAFNSDLRVRVPATGLTTYPDASVVCGRLETAPEDKNLSVDAVYHDPLAG